jgi:hypothetical protein
MSTLLELHWWGAQVSLRWRAVRAGPESAHEARVSGWRRAARWWFGAGTLAGLAALLASPPVLAALAVGWRPASAACGGGALALTPSSAGHALSLSASLGAAVAAHELGHLLCAHAWGVRVEGAAFGLLAFAVPFALVHVDARSLDSAPRHAQLALALAGVWHNAVLSLLAWVLCQLAWARPNAERGGGATVWEPAEPSLLRGLLAPGSTVVAINGVAVLSAADLADVLADGRSAPWRAAGPLHSRRQPPPPQPPRQQQPHEQHQHQQCSAVRVHALRWDAPVVALEVEYAAAQHMFAGADATDFFLAEGPLALLRGLPRLRRLVLGLAIHRPSALLLVFSLSLALLNSLPAAGSDARLAWEVLAGGTLRERLGSALDLASLALAVAVLLRPALMNS